MSRGHPLSLKLALQEFALSGQLSFSHLGYQLEDVSNVDLSDGLRERWLAPLMLKSDQFPDLVLSLEIAAVLGAEFNLIEWLDVCEVIGVSLPYGSVDVLVDEAFLHLMNLNMGALPIDNAKRCCSLIFSPL